MTMRVLTIAVLLCTALALSGATDSGKGKPKGPSRHGRQCPAGWSKFGSRCFLFLNEKKQWIEAEKYCIQLGGNLASVHSLSEYRFVQGLTAGHSFDYPLAWIGGHDAVEEGRWQWSDGSGFFYKHWSSGQPDNWGGENCICMNQGDSKGWNDCDCPMTLPFICAQRE